MEVALGSVFTQQVTVSPARLVLLMLASLIAQVVLLIMTLGRPDSAVSVVAVFSAVLYLLVLGRLWDAAASHSRALDRERILREASLSLVTMPCLPQIAEAVQYAAASLLGERSQGDALLVVRTDGMLRTVNGTRQAQAAHAGRMTDAWLPLATGTGPVLTPVRMLPEEARTTRPGAGWMLLCPLTVTEMHSGGPLTGEPLIGLIAVFSQRRVLTDLTATIEILAHQVAVTLQGVMLRQEVIRQRNEAYFRAVVQDASDATVIVADDGIVKYATPSTTAIFGNVTPEGRRFWDLVADQDRELLSTTFRQLQQGPHSGPRTVAQQVTRLDGRRVRIQARCSDLRDEPAVEGLVFTLRDVTEQYELEEQLKYRAFHDGLTGLPNRVLFQERIVQAVALAARTGLVTGVLFIDLDDFKLVNDTMGHGVGDELLAAVADRLAALVRDADAPARLGGDEFAVLVANAADETAAEAAAERLVNAFAEPFPLTTGLVSITVTVGVATTLDSSDTDELLRHADLALYAAKAGGKRQWRRYQPPLSVGLTRRREMQEALEDATAKGTFTLVYQAIVALTTGKLAGFEALIRWPHPEWGMLMPGQFIGLAEETNQIIAVGSWVLEHAAADITQWRGENAPGGELTAFQAAWHRNLYVSVNVSARQFAAPGFADTVRRTLDSTGLDPAALMLEFTETALLPRDEGLLSDLASLRSTGVRLALDGFGTGCSSLTYLAELPVDIIKMDRSLVEGIATSGQRLALAEGIVQIAATLGFKVVAEGIETEIQRDLLTSMGCHYGQGYLLAMPMTVGQAADLARTGFPEPAPPDTER